MFKILQGIERPLEVVNKQCWEHCRLKVNNSTWHDMWCHEAPPPCDSGTMRSPFRCRASLYWKKTLFTFSKNQILHINWERTFICLLFDVAQWEAKTLTDSFNVLPGREFHVMLSRIPWTSAVKVAPSSSVNVPLPGWRNITAVSPSTSMKLQKSNKNTH